jgi:hypothetical protein
MVGKYSARRARHARAASLTYRQEQLIEPEKQCFYQRAWRAQVDQKHP